MDIPLLLLCPGQVPLRERRRISLRTAVTAAAITERRWTGWRTGSKRKQDGADRYGGRFLHEYTDYRVVFYNACCGRLFRPFVRSRLGSICPTWRRSSLIVAERQTRMFTVTFELR